MSIVSINSEIVRRTLERNRVKYQTEYTIEGNLRFDFAVFVGEGNSYSEIVAVVEYDGSQHYQPQSSNSLFQTPEIVKRDELKNKWADDNNIPIIRIRECDYPSPVLLTNFLEKELIPALPQLAFLSNSNSTTNILHKNFRRRIISLEQLQNEYYSIKELSELLNYSQSYLLDRINNFSWFQNWSGLSKLEIKPYSLHKKDVIRGLSYLGFLVNQDGDLIDQVDESYLEELSETDTDETSPSVILLARYKTEPETGKGEEFSLKQLQGLSKIDLSEIDKIKVEEFNSIHSLVREGIKDEVSTIYLIGTLDQFEKGIVTESFSDKDVVFEES